MIKPKTSHFRSDKIIDRNTAAKKIRELRRRNKTSGLCHGGFDLLHPGHIKHLESASKLCDCLFVSITSDRFVALRKGSNRPIFTEILRAYSIASIKYVDYVIISDFGDAIAVVEMLKPSFYIKGPDFINKTTPGITAERKKIKALGGKIKYTSDEKLSTTNIIKHIQGNVKRDKVLLGIDRDGTLIENVKFLGKDKNWNRRIKLKKEVVDLLSYIQTKNETVTIVVSNQQGVARNYFDHNVVMSINKQIDRLLKNKGLVINSWRYCPDVDTDYANSIKDVKFNPKFVKRKTARKPSPALIYQALEDLSMSINDFDKTVIIGNSEDDLELAKNINAAYIDVTGKTYQELKNKFDNI